MTVVNKVANLNLSGDARSMPHAGFLDSYVVTNAMNGSYTVSNVFRNIRCESGFILLLNSVIKWLERLVCGFIHLFTLNS